MTENKPDLLIIYTSKNGRTGGMVEPIRQGMIDGGSTVTVRTVEEVTWDDMLAAQGIIVGTPVRFGDVDWQIKRLFDVTAYQDYPGPLSGQGRRCLCRRRKTGQRSRTGPAQYDSHTVEPRHGHPRERTFFPLWSHRITGIVSGRCGDYMRSLRHSLGPTGAAS